MPVKPRLLHIAPAFGSLIGATHAADTLLDHPAIEVAHQIYQEDTQAGLEGVRVESWYLKGSLEITEETGFRFQLLQDAITGGSPTGATDPTTGLPVFTPVTDVRQGIMGALSQKIDDHLVGLEVSRSIEDDYLSYNFALSDMWELNQKKHHSQLRPELHRRRRRSAGRQRPTAQEKLRGFRQRQPDH